jgi:hypothetical protein
MVILINNTVKLKNTEFCLTHVIIQLAVVRPTADPWSNPC